MKILESSPTRLVLEDKALVLRTICFGLVVTFLGLGLLFRPIFELISNNPKIGQDGWLIAQWAITGSAIIPLAIVVFVIKTRRLILDRENNLVTLERSGISGRSGSEYALANLVGAGLQDSFSQSSGRTRRALLEFSDGHPPVPLKPYFQSGSGPERVAVKINEWLLNQHDDNDTRQAERDK